MSECAFCSPERRTVEVDAAMSLIADAKGRSAVVDWLDEGGNPGQALLCQHGRQSSKHIITILPLVEHYNKNNVWSLYLSFSGEWGLIKEFRFCQTFSRPLAVL